MEQQCSWTIASRGQDDTQSTTDQDHRLLEQAIGWDASSQRAIEDCYGGEKVVSWARAAKSARVSLKSAISHLRTNIDELLASLSIRMAKELTDFDRDRKLSFNSL